MHLLDTNIISETRDRRRGDRRALAWIDSVETTSLYLSAMTDYELELGVLAAERRDPVHGERLRHWLTVVREEFDGRILPVTPEIARICARLNTPDRRPYADSMIAATGLHHGLTIVTRNERDFRVQGLSVLNPFRG